MSALQRIENFASVVKEMSSSQSKNINAAIAHVLACFALEDQTI